MRIIALMILLLSMTACTSMLVGGASAQNTAKKCQENPQAEACGSQFSPN